MHRAAALGLLTWMALACGQSSATPPVEPTPINARPSPIAPPTASAAAALPTRDAHEIALDAPGDRPSGSKVPRALERHEMPSPSSAQRALDAVAKLGKPCDTPHEPDIALTCGRKSTVGSVAFTQTMPAKGPLPTTGVHFRSSPSPSPSPTAPINAAPRNDYNAVIDGGTLWLELPCVMCRVTSVSYHVVALASATDADLEQAAGEAGLPRKAMRTEAEWTKALSTVATKL